METKINFRYLILYAITAFIWGSTWLVIKFQLGVIDPLVSVIYRFILSAIILLIYCYAAKLNLKFSFKEHLFIALQGFFLFGINYWFVYNKNMILRQFGHIVKLHLQKYYFMKYEHFWVSVLFTFARIATKF